MIVATEEGHVSYWEPPNRQCIFIYRAHAKPCTSIYLAPQNRCFLTCGKDKKIKVWDLPLSDERLFDSSQSEEEKKEESLEDQRELSPEEKEVEEMDKFIEENKQLAEMFNINDIESDENNEFLD